MIQYNTYNTIQYDTPIPVLYISTRARSKSIINQECQRLKPTLTEHYNIIQYNTIRYDTIRYSHSYDTIQYIQYNTIRYSHSCAVHLNTCLQVDDLSGMPEAETYTNWALQYNTIQYDTPIPVLYISTRARSKSMINQECQRLKPKLTEHYNIIQYNTIRYDTILPFLWYNKIQYSHSCAVYFNTCSQQVDD